MNDVTGEMGDGRTGRIDAVAVGVSLAEEAVEQLADRGIDVVVEQSAADVLTTLEDAEHDCLLTDVDPDGMEISAFLEGVRDRSEMLPVIAFVEDDWAILEAIDADISEVVPAASIPEADLSTYLDSRIHHVVETRKIQGQYERDLVRERERFKQFSSVVSHDLRNPLNIARSTCTLLDGDPDHLDRLDRSLRRIDAIIDDALTFARLDRTVERTVPADIETFATDCWADIECEEASLEVEDTRPVRADPDQLHELFRQLFANAIDHGDQSVRVTVDILEEGFSVSDDGTGIPERIRENAFDPGVSTTQGTGLGLAIVHEIADAHGWTVELTESDSGGARFEFTSVTFS